MTSVNLVLMGMGNVGRAFIHLVGEKSGLCRERYGLNLCLKAVLKTNGGFFAERPLDPGDIAGLPATDIVKHPAWKPGLRLDDVLNRVKPGVLVECTPTNLHTGEPGLLHITLALKKKWHVAAASKGALVVNFKGLNAFARKQGVSLKYSGATAAALPTLDVGLFSLAGTEILRIEGILTGVTNYILTRMEESFSFQEALKEAQAKGIAEPDPSLDIDGWDSAAKILLVANSVAGTSFSLKDIRREGIRNAAPENIQKARKEGKALKLLARFDRQKDGPKAEVCLTAIENTHPLFYVSGTNKGIVFFTDTMGQVTVIGGKSDPRGTAAALLKDIINIYRQEWSLCL